MSRPFLIRPEEPEIAKLYKSGMSSFQLAAKFGFQKKYILAALERQGVPRRKNETANRKYTVNEKSFDTLSEESAYWLGFLYADGQVGRSKVIILQLKRQDGYHVQRFADFLQSNSPVIPATSTAKGITYESTYFAVTHKYLGERLESIGILRHRPDFSRVLTFLTPEYYRHFIRGVFDGDGSAVKKHNLIIFAGNTDLLTWIRQVLADNTNSNPTLTIHKHKTANLHYLTYSKGRSTFQILDYLYHDTDLYLTRKRDISKTWVPSEKVTQDSKGRFEKRKSLLLPFD